MVFFETERLRLRNVSEQDADSMFDYRNNEICARFQRGQTKDRDGIAVLIQNRQQDRISTDAPFMLAVALKASDEMVGEIVVLPRNGVISIGYTFSYRHHRKGYAFEALTFLLNVLHQQYPGWKFRAFTEPENLPSINLLHKLGYSHLGYSAEEQAEVFGKWLDPSK